MLQMDSVLRQLGRPGRFHVVVFVFLCFNNMVVLLNHLAMAIYGARTPHRCTIPDGISPNDSIPWKEDSVSELDSCHVFVNYSRDSNRTVPCPAGWQYSMEEGGLNVISEFDLVCDKAYLVNLSTTIYFCGVMLGGLIFGSLSDRFGRRPIVLATLYPPIVIGSLMYFINSFALFILLRFLQGIFMQGLQTASFVLILELFPLEYRTAVGCVFEVFWGVGVLWLALIGYLVTNWRLMQLAISLPSLVAIVYIWVIPESPRWLHGRGRYDDIAKVLKQAAKFNGITLPSDPLGRKQQEDDMHLEQNGCGCSDEKELQTNKTYSLADMFRTPQLRKRSFILFYIWFVMAVVYYGLSFQITSLAGNRHLNLFLGGFCELPAYILAVFIVKRLGRRRPLCFYLFLGGATCVIAGALPRSTGSGVDIRWVSTCLAVVSRFCMAGCFSLMWLYTSELYPTVIRNVSVGACAFWTRVGGVVTPQILHLGKISFAYLPLVVFGVLSLVGGIVALLLPETKDKMLPETIEDIEHPPIGKVPSAAGGQGHGDHAHSAELDNMLPRDPASIPNGIDQKQTPNQTTNHYDHISI